MRKQHVVEEEEFEEQAGPNWTLIIVGYFAVLAVVIVLLRPLHMSMGGIFFGMVIAGAVLALTIFLIKGAMRKVATMNMTAKDAYHLAIGYIPGQGLEEEEESDATTQEPARFVADRDPLHLGERFRPSFHSFLSMNTLIVGIRRSGKSNVLAVLVEELARYGLPFILFDTMGEYGGLVDERFLIRPRLAGQVESMGEIPPAAKGWLANVTVENAYGCGQTVMKQGLQLIVNLKTYHDEDAALIMAEMSDGVNDWQEARPNRDRIPFMFFIDEAQKWFPESVQERPSDITPSTFALLQEAFVGQVVERGGKNGLGLVVATQRYSRLKKSLLQSLWKFYLRQSEEIDLARYKRQGIDPEEAKHLAQGECIVYGPDLEHFTFLARRAAAPLEGHTPGASALAKYTRELEGDDIRRGGPLPDIPRSRDESDESVSKNAPTGNRETPVYTPVNGSVNGSASTMEPLPRFRFLENTETPAMEREMENTPAEDTGNVNAETRKLIQRMVDMKKYKHREISKIVGLDGRKYDLYKQVCREMGIATEREA